MFILAIISFILAMSAIVPIFLLAYNIDKPSEKKYYFPVMMCSLFVFAISLLTCIVSGVYGLLSIL